jgi:DNA-binding MarR family transcriptional regulator
VTKIELDSVLKEIQSAELPRLTIFADSLTRLINIKLNNNLFWSLALTHLITSGGSLRPNQLAKIMHRSNYSMTKLIDNMEKNGLVTRKADPKDRRSFNIKVTSDGLAYMMETLSEYALLERKILSDLDESEINIMRNAIRKMRKEIIDSGIYLP